MTQRKSSNIPSADRSGRHAGAAATQGVARLFVETVPDRQAIQYRVGVGHAIDTVIAM